MKDKEFIQSILDKIGEFGDGELEFETRDIERLCNMALKAVKNNAVLPHVSGMCEHDYVRLAHTTFVKCSRCGKVMKHWEVKHYR